MLIIGFNKTINQLAMVSSASWYVIKMCCGGF